MNTVPPRAQIRADMDTSTREVSVSIDIMGHGCTVPLTLTEARAVRDQITELLTTFDEERERAWRPEAVRWFDTGSGPGWEVRR